MTGLLDSLKSALGSPTTTTHEGAPHDQTTPPADGTHPPTTTVPATESITTTTGTGPSDSTTPATSESQQGAFKEELPSTATTTGATTSGSSEPAAANADAPMAPFKTESLGGALNSAHLKDDAPASPFESNTTTTAAGQAAAPTMAPFKTAGLGGALNSAHLKDVDAASTTAVKDEPQSAGLGEGRKVSNISSGEAGGLSQAMDGLDLKEGGQQRADGTGVSVAPSSLPEPTVTSTPGQVGAFDSQGQKVHESNEQQPGAFGIQGGAHLNSPDNRPETAGPNSLSGFGQEGANILEPGPVMMALPPTEPSSSAASATNVPASNTATTTPSPLRESDSATSPKDATTTTPAGTTDESTTSLTTGHHHPDTEKSGGLSPTGTGVTTDDHASEVSAGSSPKTKVGFGDKVKGLVQEVKGHIKKDPVAIEQGKAIRTGEAPVSPVPSTTTQ